MDAAIRPALGTNLEQVRATNIALRTTLQASCARSVELMATHKQLVASLMSTLAERRLASVSRVTHQPSPELPDDFIIKALHEVWRQESGDAPAPAVVPIGSRTSQALRACLPEDSEHLHALRRTGKARSS